MKKNGFTLIELLAVIIVLAIVTLIAVQAVLPQVDKARKNAFVVEANNAIDAGKQWYADVVMNGTSVDTKTYSAGTMYCVKLQTLISNGYFDVSNSSDYDGFVMIYMKNNGTTSYYVAMQNAIYSTKSKSTDSDAGGKYLIRHVGKISTAGANDSTNPEVVPKTNSGFSIATLEVSSKGFDYSASTTAPDCS